MSQTWLVKLPRPEDGATRVDDAASTAGLRGGIVTEKPLRGGGVNRIDLARLDPNDRKHACAVERGGVLRSMRVGGKSGTGVERYQLHSEGSGGRLEPVSRSWRQFELVPGQNGAVLIAQSGSPNLLYSTFPESAEEKGSVVFLFGSHNGAVSCFAVSDDGAFVVSGSVDGSLAVWSVEDGEKIGSISSAHAGGVTAVAIANETCVLSAGADGCVRAWEVTEKPRLRMMHKLETGPAPLMSLAVWDPAHDVVRDEDDDAREVAAKFVKKAGKGKTKEMNTGGNGKILAAGSADGTVYVWTRVPPAKKLSSEFSWKPATTSHHAQGKEVKFLSFRADGKALLVGASDERDNGKGEVRLFETEHWTSIATHIYSSIVAACKYTRAGRSLDLALLCSAAGAPKLFEGRLIPMVSADLRENGKGAGVLPAPLGHALLPPTGNQDGGKITICEPVAPPAEAPREAAPPTPVPQTPAPVPEEPKPVKRAAFSRSGKYYKEPESTPNQRALEVVASMTASVMAKAPAPVPVSEEQGVGNEEGVSGAETELAKPSLLSTRPLLHRNALIPFAIFDKDAELQHHMAPLGVKGKEEAAAVADTHVRAMAAANMDLSLPLNARRFEGLTEIPANAPRAAKRLVGKQLDKRWLAVRDIKPRMEDMWVAARREPQVCSTEGWNTEGLLAPPSEGVEF